MELTVFNKLFAGVAEEMGIVLRRSAFSPNIKERRDYSAAVFTARGELLAQAAHIPVHLGALPLTMARVLAEHPPLAEGDILILNDPYRGGTHLPDITLITPFYGDSSSPQFYVVNRAHHADVGGATPASMPLAEDVRQEGVIIPPTLLPYTGEICGWLNSAAATGRTSFR
jgi:N-methylhydantoinase B